MNDYAQNYLKKKTHPDLFVVCFLIIIVGFWGGVIGKEPACQCRRHETQIPSLGREDPLEDGMATHSSILAWRIPWTERLN